MRTYTKKQFPVIKFKGNESLTYDRVAHKHQDGNDGLIFIHTWPTGFQRWIFKDYDHAKRWASKQ